jgi:branched-chain amino acid transport system permease protein
VLGARRWREEMGRLWARPWVPPFFLLFLALLPILLAAGQGVSPQRLVSLVVWGIMLGSILALGAVGLTLVYGILRFANFAHGDLMTLGAYLALFLLTLLPQGPALRPFSFGLELVVALGLVFPLTGLAALLIDRLLYRPLRFRRAQPVILAMAAFAAAFFVRSLIYLFWGPDFIFYYMGRPRPAVEVFGVLLRPDQLFILGLALLLVFLLYLLLEKTKLGKAMRATADNPDLARTCGIPTERVALWTWLLGGGLAGVSGVLLGLDAQLRPEMGWFMLLPLFAAVILGGIGNPYGALAGAMVIGIAQQVSTSFLNPAYAPGVAFLLMILVLLVRPQGILGRGS